MKRLCLIAVLFFGFALPCISMQAGSTRIKSTAHFRIQYERGIQDDDIKYLGAKLESTYTRHSGILGISFKRPAEVFVFKSAGRYRMESQSLIFDDGYYRSGRLYLMLPADEARRDAVKHVISRIVVMAILEYIPSCPEWLKVGYSFMAGRELDRFGPPVRVNVAQFSDLGEDYNRGATKKDLKELYAKIAETVQFLIARYGENSIVPMLEKFRNEDSLTEVFESSFNDKLEVIEDAWVKYLESAEQRR